MAEAAQATLLPDGRRLHLHHGPIDIVAEAFGPPEERRKAYQQAARRFQNILAELVDELPVLRQPITDAGLAVGSSTGKRMVAAIWPYRDAFITPMAAVAGAVAEEVLAALICERTLSRAYVNNGGDIALLLMPAHRFAAGVVADQDTPDVTAAIEVDHDMPVRGLATSGWRGRSHSLGIADAVTVLAKTAAEADAAATLIANAVDVDHPAIERTPADEVREDSDLGEHPVVIAVGPLPPDVVAAALDRGAARATEMRELGLIHAAQLILQGQARTVGPLHAANGG